MSDKWYLIMTGQFGYPQPENDFGYLEKTYEADRGCSTCKIGFVQANPFRFRTEPKAKQSQFIGLNWVSDQIFVREPVKLEFEKEKVTGIRFSRPVLHSTGERLKTVFQMHVETVLPEGLIGSNLATEVCQIPTEKEEIKILEAIGSKLLEGPFCGKTKYNFPQSQKIRFQKSIFQNQPDIVRTNEWFGSGGSANRPVLISERVKDIIEQNKWRAAFLQPIELVE